MDAVVSGNVAAESAFTHGRVPPPRWVRRRSHGGQAAGAALLSLDAEPRLRKNAGMVPSPENRGGGSVNEGRKSRIGFICPPAPPRFGAPTSDLAKTAEPCQTASFRLIPSNRIFFLFFFSPTSLERGRFRDFSLPGACAHPFGFWCGPTLYPNWISLRFFPPWQRAFAKWPAPA